MRSATITIFTVLLFFASSVSHSATFIRYSGVTGWYPTYASACQAFSDWHTNGFTSSLEGNNCRRYYANGQPYDVYQPMYQSGNQCPSGYTENESGYCEEIQDPQCPAGQTDIGNGCEFICPEGNTFTSWVSLNEAKSNPASYSERYDSAGCKGYATTQTNGCTDNFTDGVMRCQITYAMSTEWQDPDDINDDQTTDYENEDLESKQDNRQNTSTTEQGETTTTNNADGSVTEQSTKTETSKQGEGVVMWNDGQTLYIQDSTGNVTEIVWETTKTTEPDGSVTETIIETRTETSPTKETVIVTQNSVSTNTKAGTSSSTTKTTTNTYDGDGNQTGSTTTETGDGDSDGQCDPDIQTCGDDEDFSFSAGDKSGLYEKTDKTYESVITEFQSRMLASELGSAMNGFFDVSLSGSCPVWTIPAVGVMGASIGPFNVDMQCSTAMNTVWPIVSGVLLIIAGFVAWRVAVGD